MNKIYLVQGSWADYDWQAVWIVKASLSREKAEKLRNHYEEQKKNFIVFHYDVLKLRPTSAVEEKAREFLDDPDLVECIYRIKDVDYDIIEVDLVG